MKIGFIGLGIMGSSMVANLQKAGFTDLVVNDLRREVAEAALKAGATWANTPAEVAGEVEVIFTSLPGPPEMEKVTLGENGLLSGVKPGTTYFDLTSNSPTVVRRISKLFAEKGVTMLDAPVSGAAAGAKNGKMAFWVGGDEAAFTKYREVLAAMGDRQLHVGEVGNGSITKLVHNCAGFGIQAVLAEVFSLGVKAGMEPLELWHAIRQGVNGRNRTFDRLPPQFLTNRLDPPSFMLKLAHKDVSLATALGRELKVPMRIADLALAELTEGMNRGWENLDCRVAMHPQLERSGVPIPEVDYADVERLLAEDALVEAAEAK